MKITSKASITIAAALSATEILAAVAGVPGVRDAIIAAAQAEAVKDASGLTFVSRDVKFAADGSAVVELVYEKAEGAAQDDAAPPPPAISLTVPGAAPAGA